MGLADAMGPLEYLILEFPGSQFRGEMAPALAELIDTGVVHLIDLVWVKKGLDGTVTYGELEDLRGPEAEAFAALQPDGGRLVSEEDIAMEGQQLAPGDSAVVLVWENLWATRLAQAVRRANGQVVAGGRIPHTTVEAALLYAAQFEQEDELAA